MTSELISRIAGGFLWLAVPLAAAAWVLAVASLLFQRPERIGSALAVLAALTASAALGTSLTPIASAVRALGDDERPLEVVLSAASETLWASTATAFTLALVVPIVAVALGLRARNGVRSRAKILASIGIAIACLASAAMIIVRVQQFLAGFGAMPETMPDHRVRIFLELAPPWSPLCIPAIWTTALTLVLLALHLTRRPSR